MVGGVIVGSVSLHEVLQRRTALMDQPIYIDKRLPALRYVVCGKVMFSVISVFTGGGAPYVITTYDAIGREWDLLAT